METTIDAPPPSDAADDLTVAPVAGSTFLIGLEVCLWSLYVIAAVMVMVVVMMN